MNKILRIIYIVIVIFSFSCRLSEKKNIKEIIQKWNGKEIMIPAGIEYKIFGRDTLCSDLWNKPFKFLVYIDSLGCTSCKLGLPEWKVLIDSCHQQQLNVGFIFVVYSSDFEYFEHEILLNNFNYPIIYDDHNRFDKINNFPPAPYRTFLLDQNNKVLLVGSPINNPKMWELYKKVISPSK